jgi:hypothetical protein
MTVFMVSWSFSFGVLSSLIYRPIGALRLGTVFSVREPVVFQFFSQYRKRSSRSSFHITPGVWGIVGAGFCCLMHTLIDLRHHLGLTTAGFFMSLPPEFSSTHFLVIGCIGFMATLYLSRPFAGKRFQIWSAVAAKSHG